MLEIALNKERCARGDSTFSLVVRFEIKASKVRKFVCSAVVFLDPNPVKKERL